MSVFYVDKGPGAKKPIGGYTISNTGGTDFREDPSGANYPGVGTYITEHAYSKTTFHRKGPNYSIPTAGAYNIDVLLS